MAAGNGYLWQNCAPVVAVAASDAVQELCAANRIATLVDLLLPFGRALETRVTTRLGGRQTELPDFQLSFVDVVALDAFVTSALLEHELLEILREHAASAPDWAAAFDAARRDGSRVDAEALSPWYASARELVAHSVGVQEYETFRHPVALLYAVSCSEPDAVASFNALMDAQRHPAAMKSGLVDASVVLRHYVLIRDAGVTAAADAEALVKQVQKLVGPSVSLLTVNTRSPAAGAEQDSRPAVDIWAPYTAARVARSRRQLAAANRLLDPDVDPVEDLGHSAEPPETEKPPTLLSQADSQRIAEFVGALATRYVVPFMEQQIALWNSELAEQRRGLTNRLFSAGRKYFGGTAARTTMVRVPWPGAQTPGDAVDVFPWTSPEATLRKLADYAFMLRDLRLAQGVYEMVRKDATRQMPQAARYLVAAQQMLGICQLLQLGAARTQLGGRTGSGTPVALQQSALDSVLGSALELRSAGSPTVAPASLSPTSATPASLGADSTSTGSLSLALSPQSGGNAMVLHAALLCYELVRESGDQSDLAANVLLRAVTSDPLARNALLLEQAALAFAASSSPPLWRRCTLRLVMATDRFDACGLDAHALRTARAADALLSASGGKWPLVRDHMRGVLARLAPDASLEHLVALAQVNDQAAETQEALIAEVVAQHRRLSGQNAPAVRVLWENQPIPALDAAQLRLEPVAAASAGASPRIPANAPPTSAREDAQAWQNLERQALLALPTRGTPTNQTLGRPAATMRADDDAERAVAVDEPLVLQITLGNPLSTNVLLKSVFLEVALLDENGEPRDSPAPTPEPVSLDPTADQLVLEHCTVDHLPHVFLPAGSTLSFAMTVTPKVEGRLRVTALRYTLFGVLPCRTALSAQGRRLNDTQQQRCTIAHAPSGRLTALVGPRMPRLEARLVDAPTTLLSGQVVPCALAIANCGSTPLVELAVATNLPSFVVFGSPGASGSPVDSQSLYVRRPGPADAEEITVSNALDPQALAVTRLDLSGSSLAPGASLTVPVWLRGDRIGRHALRLLFAYRGPAQSSAAVTHRTLALTNPITVAPSLRINAFTRPRPSRLGEFVLGLEIENLLPDRVATVHQIAAVSPHWGVSRLVNDAKQNSEMPELAPQNACRVYLAVTQGQPPAAPADLPDAICADRLARMIVAAAPSGAQDPTPSAPFPPIALRATTCTRDGASHIAALTPVLQSFLLAARTNWRLSHCRSQHPHIPPVRIAHLFPRHVQDDVDLVLFWTLRDPVSGALTHGHHYIVEINLAVPGLQASLLTRRLASEYALAVCPANAPLASSIVQTPAFAAFVVGRALTDQTAKDRVSLLHSFTRPHLDRPGTASERELASSAPLVSALVQAPETVATDSATRTATISVTVELCNTAWHSSAVFEFDIDAGSANPLLCWAGPQQWRGSLRPGERVQRVFTALLLNEGLYDMGRWRLSSAPAEAAARGALVPVSPLVALRGGQRLDVCVTAPILR